MDWRSLVEWAVLVIRKHYPKASVYIAGSIVRGEATAASDIDLVVVLDHEPSMKESAHIISLVWEELNLPPSHPLEIHVVGPQGKRLFERAGMTEVG
jgi:hypothetical protein